MKRIVVFNVLIIFQFIAFIRSQCNIQLDITMFRCIRQKLTEIPSHIHKNTIDLDLSHNLIEILHEDSFSRLPVIRRLNLGNNRIYKITERAFLPISKNLTYLDLRNNQILSSITIPFPVSAFAPLVNVQHLDLSGNPLGFLPTGFLRYMGQSLKQLDISSLAIGIKMEPGSFNGLSRVQNLNLAYNTFSELAEESFSGLRPEHFVHLNLDGVHWHCDCHILWLRRWLNRIPSKALQLTKKPGGECISPPNFKGQALILLNFTSLQCEPRILNTIPPRNEVDLQSPVHVIGYEGHNLTIMCAFISEPKMNVNWYHGGVLIQPHWSRITQTITPGTKFTTSLHFHGLRADKHAGLYQCQASNRKGQASASFRLEVSSSSMELNDPTKRFRSSDQDLFEYFGHILLLIGSIVIANAVLVLIGFITYKCVKKRRYNHVIKQIPPDHSDLTKNSDEVLSLKSQCLVNKTNTYNHIQHQPIYPIDNTERSDGIIYSPHLRPNPLHHTDLTSELISQTFGMETPSRNHDAKFTKSNPVTSLGPLVDMNQCEHGEPVPLNRTPSLQSSDMGYPGSGSSHTGGSYGMARDCGRPTQNRPYYTLSLRSKNQTPELVYRPTLTASEFKHQLLETNDFSILDEIRLMEKKFGTNSSPDTPPQRHDSDVCPTCPVHGDPDHQKNLDHSCALHSHLPPDICPIHGPTEFGPQQVDDKPGNLSSVQSSRDSVSGNQRRHSMQLLSEFTNVSELCRTAPWDTKKTNTIPKKLVQQFIPEASSKKMVPQL